MDSHYVRSRVLFAFILLMGLIHIMNRHETYEGYIESPSLNVAVYPIEGWQVVDGHGYLPDPSFNLARRNAHFEVVAIDTVYNFAKIEYDGNQYWVEIQYVVILNDNDWRRLDSEVTRDLNLAIQSVWDN